MPEMHLRQPGFTYSQHGFTYSICEPFTKNKEEDRNLKKQVICNIYISKRTRGSLFSTWHGLWRF